MGETEKEKGQKKSKRSDMDDEDAETGRKSAERSVKSEKCGLTRDTTGGGRVEGRGGGRRGERVCVCLRMCECV